MLMSWLHRPNKLKLLPRRNLPRLLRINKRLMRPKWPPKLLRELDLRN